MTAHHHISLVYARTLRRSHHDTDRPLILSVPLHQSTHVPQLQRQCQPTLRARARAHPLPQATGAPGLIYYYDSARRVVAARLYQSQREHVAVAAHLLRAAQPLQRARSCAGSAKAQTSEAASAAAAKAPHLLRFECLHYSHPSYRHL